MIEQSLCPFCHSQNSCMVDSPDSCWCNQVKIPQALRELHPKEQQDTVCICNNCIARFNKDERQFKELIQ